MRSRTSTRSDEGPGFRKVRRALGVTAFGVNAIELPPGYETGRHYHETQEELYFVHRGRVEITFDDGSAHVLGPGGLARVDAATVRKIKNVGDEPAVYLVAGGKDGYVGRDGLLPEGEDQQVRPGGPARLVRRARPRGREPMTLPRQPCHRRRPLLAPRCPPSSRRDNPWNQRVDRLPVHARSDAIVRSIGAGDNMHADFGSGLYEGGPIGIPLPDRARGARRRCR